MPVHGLVKKNIKKYKKIQCYSGSENHWQIQFRRTISTEISRKLDHSFCLTFAR